MLVPIIGAIVLLVFTLPSARPPARASTSSPHSARLQEALSVKTGQRVVRAGTAALLLEACAICITGCTSLDAPGYPGAPTASGQPLVVDAPAGSEISAWSDGDLLVVTTIGSGSCPVVPAIEEVDEDERRVTLSTSIPNAQGACTADSSPRTFELDAGRDLAGFTVRVTGD